MGMVSGRTYPSNHEVTVGSNTFTVVADETFSDRKASITLDHDFVYELDLDTAAVRSR